MRPPQTLCTFKVEDAECSYRREDAECSYRREDAECSYRREDAECSYPRCRVPFPARREGAERSLRSINLHFLSPFSNTDLSNIVFRPHHPFTWSPITPSLIPNIDLFNIALDVLEKII